MNEVVALARTRLTPHAAGTSIAADLAHLAVEADRRIRCEACDQHARRIGRSGEGDGVGRQPGEAQGTVIRFVTDQKNQAMTGSSSGSSRR